MDKPKISAIAAIGHQNREVGKKGNLIWKLPNDMKRFQEITSGHAVIMGRKTWESIPVAHRPLKNRTNIVITRNKDYDASGAVVVTSINEALEEAYAVEKEEIFVIGGSEIWEQALPKSERLYLTLVEAEDRGADTFFPAYDEFKKVIKEEQLEDGGFKTNFRIVEKKSSR